jgi:N-acetylmuramic acid 6-phosphate etherase
VSQFTELESRVYKEKKHSFYFAQDAMISIFTDLTERSPTFGLNPIDTINTLPKRSWITMFTNADSTSSAWLKFLGRPFKGLAPEIFEPPFQEITDLDLRRRALNSLKNAGADQQHLYDFSFSEAN